jgi:transposase
MRIARSYTNEYKIEAVKLAHEVGPAKASHELDIPDGTMYTWMRQEKLGTLEVDDNTKPQNARKLADEVKQLKHEIKQRDTQIKEQERIIEILKEASVFFAKSQRR